MLELLTEIIDIHHSSRGGALPPVGSLNILRVLWGRREALDGRVNFGERF